MESTEPGVVLIRNFWAGTNMFEGLICLDDVLIFDCCIVNCHNLSL